MSKLIGILFIVVVVLQRAPAQEFCGKERLKDSIRRCAISHRVGQAEILRLIYGRPSHSGREKCFRACSIIECRFFNIDGTLRQDTPNRIGNYLAIGNPQKAQLVRKLASNCLKHIPLYGSVCDTAEAFIHCMVSTSPVPLSLDQALN
ncbi:uncharacterized protein LOC131802283 [Musca domestica]|uniref:Uncharacterized protein LOC131802283 n=1 Tax=Musca domestica TaxID=7370 RepID=A0ABM3UXI5_MUSDO|nr:uncharacterized protein LOC131802283 [Musca domestica]